MSKSDLTVMQEMARENENIMAGTNLVSAQKTKQGTQITMGIGADVVGELTSGKLIPVIYLVDKEQFFKRKKS